MAVGDELQPHAAGSAVYAGAEHFGAAEGAQQASRAIAAVVDLGGTRNRYWKTSFVCYLRDQIIHECAHRHSSLEASEIFPTKSLT